MGLKLKNFLTRLVVVLLVVTFGCGSWVSINGLWVELPVLVALGIPEGYNLASYLVIIIHLANIGPFIFAVVNWRAPKGIKIEVPAICIIMLIALASCLLLPFFWDKTTTWTDHKIHSTALLCLAFFLAIVDCTSSVAFTPFMARFKSMYLTWYFVGEGVSGLLPSLVALVQGVGGYECFANYTFVEFIDFENKTYLVNCSNWIQQPKAPNFPPRDFFWFLFFMMLCSAAAFALLNVLPIAKGEHAIKRQSFAKNTNSTTGFSEDYSMYERRKNRRKNRVGVETDVIESTESFFQSSGPSRIQYVYLYCILGYANALSNSILPSVQSYSAGAYGMNMYLLVATLGNVANPVACFLVMAAPSMNLMLVGGMACLGSAAGAYCLATAVLSPTPPLQTQTIGSAVIVMAWVLAIGMLTYTKATIGWILRNQPDNRTLLIWFGGVTQIGSLVGAFIMFPLVTIGNFFEGYYEDPCAGLAGWCDDNDIGALSPASTSAFVSLI